MGAAGHAMHALQGACTYWSSACTPTDLCLLDATSLVCPLQLQHTEGDLFGPPTMSKHLVRQ